MERKHQPSWTEEELQIIKDKMLNSSIYEIGALLPNRSISAIKNKVKRLMFGKPKKRKPLGQKTDGFYRGVLDGKEYIFEVRGQRHVFLYHQIDSCVWQTDNVVHKVYDYEDVLVVRYRIKSISGDTIVGLDIPKTSV